MVDQTLYMGSTVTRSNTTADSHGWILIHMKAISVRYKSLPRKMSRYEVFASISFSRSYVCTIIASRSSIPSSWNKRLSELSASSSLFFRMNHHGDSGANKLHHGFSETIVLQ